jgi:hypothetical protein
MKNWKKWKDFEWVEYIENKKAGVKLIFQNDTCDEYRNKNETKIHNFNRYLDQLERDNYYFWDNGIIIIINDVNKFEFENALTLIK